MTAKSCCERREPAEFLLLMIRRPCRSISPTLFGNTRSPGVIIMPQSLEVRRGIEDATHLVGVGCGAMAECSGLFAPLKLTHVQCVGL